MAARLVDYENAGRSIAPETHKKSGCSFLLYIFAAVVIAGILAALSFLGDLNKEDFFQRDIPIVRVMEAETEFSMSVSVERTTTVKVVQVEDGMVIFEGQIRKNEPVELTGRGDIRIESKDIGGVGVRVGNQRFTTSDPHALSFAIKADAAISAYSVTPTAPVNVPTASTQPTGEFTNLYTLTVFVSETTRVKITQQADGKVLKDETMKPGIPVTAVARSAILVESNDIKSVIVQVGGMNYQSSSPDAFSFIVLPRETP